jgi:site-specific DNA-methyltransferase (adenine-specific)
VRQWRGQWQQQKSLRGPSKMTHHKIVIGDSRIMREVVDNSIHLIVTSPPYWQLKDYGIREQIGYNDSYEEYIDNLNQVWGECYRVLHPGCRMCINIGDQFARSVFYGRYKVIPIRTEIIKHCESIGLDYMGAIIWQKATTCHTTGGATVMGSYPYPRSGIIKIDYEFILIFKKLGRAPRVSKEIKEQSKLTDEEWNEYFYGHWDFPGEKQDKHLAAFPEELPKRLIKMFSFVGDTILDPFLGSGTTSIAAMKLNRNSIGYEINEDYIKIIKKRLTENVGLFEQEARFEIIKQPMDIDFKKQAPLKAPATLERKVNPKLLRFGSKINGSEKEPEGYYTVKKVLSPARILLDTGAEIHLMGIKANDRMYVEAIRFLEKLTKGQKVFLKFDGVKYDENNRLLCYLYLKNKTLVNAHLIKNNLVDVDTTHDYKYKSKFLEYERRSKNE